MSGSTLARWTAMLAAALLLSLLGSVPASADEGRPTSAAPKSGSGTATADDPARLVKVEVATHETYDRVVFEYTNGTPGYDIAYGQVDEPGTGQLVDLRGSRSLEVITHDSTGVRGGPLEGTTTNWTFRMPSVAQVSYLGSFEQVGKAGIGISAESPVPFRVFTLSGPARLVIDVAHAAANPPESDGTTPPARDSTSAPARDDPQQSREGGARGEKSAGLGQTSKGGVIAASSTTEQQPAAYKLGLIGAIALASLTGAALVIRKIRSNATG